MSAQQHIQNKLSLFARKYYKNELIRGGLLFIAIGVLTFLGVVFVEYILWLDPLFRTILFWMFIALELFLLVRFIIIPLFKLFGLKKGLDDSSAAKIIGDFFPEINDKLLNMIQLSSKSEQTELLKAAIEQKSTELKPVHFGKAISYSGNKRYLKYAFLPLFIWLFVHIIGKGTYWNNSVTRVMNYTEVYEPPAPFSFYVENDSLKVIEGQPFELIVAVKGSAIPENVKVNFDDESYYMEQVSSGLFRYEFPGLINTVDFHLKANDVTSRPYTIDVIPTPVISNLKMVMDYPEYTGKVDEVIANTGNALIPAGTLINWQIETFKTDQITFHRGNNAKVFFDRISNNYFNHRIEARASFHYTIGTSNSALKEHEKLNFEIEVIPDEYPRIVVQSDIDSAGIGPVQFVGQINDDYGLRNLKLVYYKKESPQEKTAVKIPISAGTYSEFYYLFPSELDLEKGANYELYFEVYDNDSVHGSKRTMSKTFNYYQRTVNELSDELLKEQQNQIESIDNTVDELKKEREEMKKFREDLQNKAKSDWNDSQMFKEFMNRQKSYQEMFEKQTKSLERNLLQQPEQEGVEDKKQQLQERLKEIQEMNERDKLREELEELVDKLDKEQMLDRMKEMARKNQRNEKNLERMLELTKRFYVEQKQQQIMEKLAELGKTQEAVIDEESNEKALEDQLNIKKEFSDQMKEMEELKEMNEELMRPMMLPDNEEKLEEINDALNKALQNLEMNNASEARKSQKKAARKMQEMSQDMESQMMQGDMEMIDENIDDLRMIIENLIEFSFQQEEVRAAFLASDRNSPEFPKNLKTQQSLKEYFEHIDDSLYVLSLRLAQMSSSIQKDLSDAHYFIDESLQNFTENRFDQGVSNQQFVITASNNLANLLGDILESLMNASMQMSQGGKGKNDIMLPDIIKKQGELKEGVEKGRDQQRNGEREGNSEEDNEALYEIFKEQSALKNLMNELIQNSECEECSEQASELNKKMEELELELLEKGFTNEAVERMQELEYELLKLDDALKQQGEENKRTGNTNRKIFDDRFIEKLELDGRNMNYREILNRQSLPLRSIYKKRVQEYFKTNE